MAGLERRHSGLPPTPSSDKRYASFRAESSASSLTQARDSAGFDGLRASRGGPLSDKARRAAVLNEQYLLGEELGRGAFGQVRASPAVRRWTCLHGPAALAPALRVVRLPAAGWCLARPPRLLDGLLIGAPAGGAWSALYGGCR